MEATNGVVLLLSGPLTAADGPRLCAELVAGVTRRRAGAGGPGTGPGTGPVVEIRAGDLGRPDLTAVDILARLRLTARRLGCPVRVTGARPDVLDLLRMTGLGALAEDAPTESA